MTTTAALPDNPLMNMLLRRCGLDPLLLRQTELYVPYARFA